MKKNDKKKNNKIKSIKHFFGNYRDHYHSETTFAMNYGDKVNYYAVGSYVVKALFLK